MKLTETTYGMAIVRSGDSTPLDKSPQNNCFVCEKDPVYYDSNQKPLSLMQKPVKFFGTLVELYSTEGDWILDGYSGTGLFLYYVYTNYWCFKNKVYSTETGFYQSAEISYIVDPR